MGRSKRPRRSGVLTGARIVLLFTHGPLQRTEDERVGAHAPHIARLLGDRHRVATARDLDRLVEAGILESWREVNRKLYCIVDCPETLFDGE